MAVDYKRVSHLMKDKEMTNYQFMEVHFSPNIALHLKRNRSVPIEMIENICRVMNCRVDDVLEFIPDEKGDS